MTAVVAMGLLTLALLDTTFSGFRSSLGRTGLIEHRAADLTAARRGAVLGSALLAPAVIVMVADVTVAGASATSYQRAGEAALLVVLPYAMLTFIALSAYAFMGWRQKYLASAAVLGPFVLFRPFVVVAGALAGILRADDAAVTVAILFSAAAVLAVEPLADHLWYARPD